MVDNVRGPKRVLLTEERFLAQKRLLSTTGGRFTKPSRLTEAGLSDEHMHLLYALVRKSSFSAAQGFVKPAAGLVC